ncbi:hypothetical protein [Streptomyces iconiensis]|uniref:Restriction endonuclease n=1 Tax=Streptomyces iconiensis TaxID=1384038 RepID=A0ABT6ZY89_9ACTN|nr:hypothetical protein [Streptomyces iconiensis]MDJ1133779.1 hypothetical protein [Streptomyces iconiensis]
MAMPIGPLETSGFDENEIPEIPDILDVAASLPVPEGYRVQVIEGRIIVTPPPDGDRSVALQDLSDTLTAAGVRAAGLRVLRALPAAGEEGVRHPRPVRGR